ncbi:MAG: exodeoxyribonuclease VII small subunit [Anaerolineaceae bacterium]|nr:exodeoxyribonuclease VII small subunit [Anaerolineaceae bacterium]
MGKTQKDTKDLSYEEAFEELNAIVAKLEEDESTLEEAMAFYERGQALQQRCAELLEKAELKLKVLGEELGE